MPLVFRAPVDWDAFYDEYSGIWEIAAREHHTPDESQESISYKVRRATRFVINAPENYEKFK